MNNIIAHKPTGLERKLYRILDSLHVLYSTEEERGPYQLDCYLPVHNIGIEADGPWHIHRKDGDRRRDDRLWADYGIKVLRLDSTDLRDDQVARSRILAFIRE